MRTLKVAKWIESGRIGDDARTQEDILEACGGLLDDAESHEIIGGGVLFRATNGRHYIVTVEAVISEASEDLVRDALSEAGQAQS